MVYYQKEKPYSYSISVSNDVIEPEKKKLKLP